MREGRSIRLVLTIGCLVGGCTVALAAGATDAPAGTTSSSGGAWTFVSAPDLHPTKLEVLARRPGLAQGEFLVTGQPDIREQPPVGQAGPLLLDTDARPVWALPGEAPATDLQQETYRGHPVLVWFQASGGPGQRGNPHTTPPPAHVLIYDEHYRRVATLSVHSPWTIDLHDTSIAGPHMWVTVTRIVPHQNLTRYGGPRHAVVQDVGLQEFSISTGRLLRTWDALNPGGRPNVPLSASKERPTQDWDAYHLNSVQALPDGDLLVSMRNTWSVYLIDPVAPRIIWTLGGKDSTFKVPQAAHFAWQHDARIVDTATSGQGAHVELTVFDDNSRRGPAKGLILRLNTLRHQAKLVAAYPHHPSYYAQFLGSMQLLPNGNTLVDWGSPYAYFTEFSQSGKQLLNVAWPSFGQSYRTLFTDTWVGSPHYPPSGAVRGSTVYASWNGDTQVARWEVLAGSSTRHLRVVASRSRDGFETAIKVGQHYGVYEVRALDAGGHALGTSKLFS